MDDRIVNLFENRPRQPVRPRPIDLAHEPDFDLGASQVIPSRRLVIGPQGEAVLQPKVMQVLVALGQSGQTLLSRDDLIERCWEGRIVGDASINRVISLLRQGLRDATGDAVQVETVPKVGFRLLVDDSSVAAETGALEQEIAPTSPSRMHRSALAAFAVIAVLVVAFNVWRFWPAAPAAQPVTIAMLPISVASTDDPFFATGFASQLRSELARGQLVTVTTSDTALQLSGGDSDLAEVGKRLQADYVWSGELGRSASGVTLSSRMVAVDGGEVVWEETLVSGPQEAGMMPLRAARSMLREIGRESEVALLGASLPAAARERLMLAEGMIYSRDPAQLEAALPMLQQLVEANPDNAASHALLAKAMLLAESNEPVADRRALALGHARRALAIDERSVEAHKALGMLAPTAEERFANVRRATELDPGDREAWLWLSHVAAFPDFAEHEAVALRRLVALDPLWGRSWQSSYAAAALEGIEAGEAIDRAILAAAAEGWQRDAAEGRIAGMNGDLSEFYRLSMQALPAMSAEQQQVTGMQLANTMLLLDLPFAQPPARGVGALAQKVVAGQLPSQAEFAAAGVDARSFWQITPLHLAGPSLFIRDGRSAELLALWDGAFASPAEFVRYAEPQLRSGHIITNTATYVGLAMQRNGREDEARVLFDLAERYIARWRAHDAMSMTPLLFEANLAAARGQPARARAAVEGMIDYGWPWVLQSPGVPLTGPLLGDPAWQDLQDDPELVRLLAPIRTRIARERAEVRGLTGG